MGGQLNSHSYFPLYQRYESVSVVPQLPHVPSRTASYNRDVHGEIVFKVSVSVCVCVCVCVKEKLFPFFLKYP
jgi:hypothetical protein